MVKLSHINLKMDVAVPIAMVNRVRDDPRNITRVILDREEHDMYNTEVKYGILSTKLGADYEGGGVQGVHTPPPSN